MSRHVSGAHEPIAIVGVACRLPRAADPRAFWHMLREGLSGITEVPRGRWDADAGAGAAEDAAAESTPAGPGIRWGGFLDGVDDFDPAFFSISPREAAAMDPQQRLILELGWEALEDAGLRPERVAGCAAGVFVGAIADDYATLLQRGGAQAIDSYTFTGVNRAIIANRLSYALSLNGPSLTVDSGQCSSLLAVHLACQSLRQGESELALAGGVQLNLARESALRAAKLGVLSPDGRSYTFDARANGFVRGEGGGLVVLKTLSKARADGDDIYCVIRGSAVNNDGSGEGLTVPSPEAQRDVIRAALRQARLEPADVQYVELHGTGTPLGDQVEAAALGAVFTESRAADAPLVVGSVKTNVGHLEGAAGIVGLLKVALSIRHGLIPGQVDFERADESRVPLRAFRLDVRRQTGPWPDEQRPAAAGVSSFGVGGTNCHLVVSAPPGGRPDDGPRAPRPTPAAVVWPVGARSGEALRDQARRLLEYAEAAPALDPLDIGFTLATARSAMSHRAAVVGSSRAELLSGLRALAEGVPSDRVVRGKTDPLGPGRTVFVFPGQGSQWTGMGTALLESSPVFRAHVEECEEAFRPYTGWSLTEVLSGRAGAAQLDRVDVVQPALFSVMVALAALWRSLGVEPDAVVGHSQGEIAAACVAGALTLPEAARVVALRSQAIGRLAGTGGMVALALSTEELTPYLRPWEGRLCVSAENSPASTVVGGDTVALDALLTACERDGVRARRVPVDYASHSHHVDEVRDELLAALRDLAPRASLIPFYSTVTTAPLDTAGLDGDYWFRNLRGTVRFEGTVGALLADGHGVFLEMSPHPVLVQSVEETAEDRPARVRVSAIGSLRKDDGGLDCFLMSVARAHVRGASPDWDAVYAGTGARRAKLPGYPFQRQRYWLDTFGTGTHTAPGDRTAAAAKDHAAPAQPPPRTARPGGDSRHAPDDLVRGQAAVLLGYPGPDAVDPDATFRDLGITSATAVELRNRLQDETGLRLPTTLLYDQPTPAAVTRFLRELSAAQFSISPQVPAPQVPAQKGQPCDASGAEDPVVIVGMGCRLPGGVSSPEKLWRLVSSGTDAISPFPTNRGWDLKGLYDAEPGRPHKTYVRAGGFLHDADRFDAAFFGISPREALAMDPQQRILLETAWETVESAGIIPSTLRSTETGVFVGAMAGDYGPRLHNIPSQIQGYALTGGAPSVLSGRIAYTLGLTGPAVTVDTACSSSLVAIHLAVRSLRQKECRLALAGGVTVMSGPGMFLEFSKQRGMSPDGRCRAFSADADGTGWGEGVGLLLLERLSDARRQGHPVLAVVRGSAVNQDGASNGLTAPNGPSQERVIRAALADAGLTPDQIDLVEAHGTGTRLGDPIEARALLATYGRQRPARRPLMLGSLKSNIGHAQAAAGVAGVIKTVLALHHATMPPTLYADEPTEHVDWDEGAVRLLTKATPWPAGQERPRRAGVSAFGISGTNAHVIIEEPQEPQGPVEREVEPGEPASPAALVLWPLSATAPEGLPAQAGRLRAHLDSHPELSPGQVGYALATSRTAFEERAVVVAAHRAEFDRALVAMERGVEAPEVVRGKALGGRTAFLFTGQGSQRPGMGSELHRAFPAFADALDEVCAHLDARLERPLREVMFAPTDSPGGGLLHRTDFTQAALFAFEVALHRQLTAFGVVPDAVLGHSVGELAAAYAAGVFPLEDACALVAARGRLMAALPEGGTMAALQASENEIRPLLAGREQQLAVAAVNGPESVVVSGDAAAVHELVERWRAEGRRTELLRVSHAFHSPRMDSMLAQFQEAAAGVRYTAPRIPLISNLTGRAVTGAEVCSPEYWTRHIRRTVRFHDGVRTLSTDGVKVFLEVGPRGVLSALVRQAVSTDGAEAADQVPVVVAAMRSGQPEERGVMQALARLHTAGRPLDWEAVFDCSVRRAEARDRRPRPVALSTYAFQRERYWLQSSAPASDHSAEVAGVETLGHPTLRTVMELPDSNGFVFSTRLSLESHPWLADHAVLGTVLFPAAGFVDWALEAGRRTGCSHLTELTLEAPLTIPDQGGVLVRLTVDGRDATDHRRLSVHSHTESARHQTWTRHATGLLGPDDSAHILGEAVTPAAPLPRTARQVSHEEAYESLESHGFRYGPAFRGLTEAWHDEDEVRAEVHVAEGMSPPASAFAVHPVLLDAALHGAVLPLLDRAETDAGVLLPFAWSDVHLHTERPAAGPLHVFVTTTADNAVSLHATDGTGTVVLSVGGLVLRRTTADRLATAVRPGGELLTLDWQPAVGPSPRPGAQLAVLGADRLGLFSLLKPLGHQIEHYSSLHSLDVALRSDQVGVDTVLVTCASEEDSDALLVATERALVLVQEWIADELLVDRRLVFVTRGAVAARGGECVTDLAGAAVWGLVRSAQSEHPGLFALLDLDSGAEQDESVGQAVLTAVASGEPQLAVRGGAALRPRLTPLRGAARKTAGSGSMPMASRWRRGAVLLTGGTGALGRVVSRHLVETHGVRDLVLLSRTGRLAPGAEELATELAESGARVRVLACDASDREALGAAVAAAADRRPLVAVLHLAGIVEDQTTARLTPRRLERVLGPKALGASHLHDLTRELPDCDLVLFSSVMGILGGSGQANYAAANAYLDALAGLRRAMGLRAVSLAWGLWEQGIDGMGAELGAADLRRMRRYGLVPMSVREGLALFDAASTTDEAVLAPVALDARAMDPAGSLPDVLRDLAPRDSGPGQGRQEGDQGEPLSARLARMTPGERGAALLELVRSHAAQVLGHRDLDAVPPKDDLFEIGFDSLTTLELSNRLTVATGLRLPATLVFEHPSPAGLAASLEQAFPGETAPRWR